MRAKSDIDPRVRLSTEIRKRLLKKGGIWSCKMLVYPVLGFYLLGKETKTPSQIGGHRMEINKVEIGI